jgi:flagellar hook-associated protein 1 FlgK
LFDISVSALQAFQTAITVTENNIANYNTPGYAVETANLTNVAPQYLGGATIGDGVDVASITRSVNQLTNNQLNASQSSLGSLDSLQTYTSQIDNIIGTTAGGLTTALQGYYSAWSAVATNPTSTASRQALLGQAQSVASSFQNTSSQLQALNVSINQGISGDVTQINSLSATIATLNTQITNSPGTAANGQPPNGLLDQRDAALTSLSKLVGVTTSTDTNGGLNVFVGNGQPLVLQGTSTALTTVGNQFNATQLEVSTAAGGSANNLSSQITTGDLGGLLSARTQAVDPAMNQVGQIAAGFGTTANAQQNVGLDLTGKLGANLFTVGGPTATVGGPTATASSSNAGAATGTGATAAVTVTDIGLLTTSDYILTYTGAIPSLTNASTGAKVAFTGTGTGAAGSPLTADGLSITLTGTPASGDKFLIQPTATAAGAFAVAITSSSQIAAAGAVQASAASANTGTGSISAGTVSDPTQAFLLDTATIKFSDPTTYTVTTQVPPPGAPPAVFTGTLAAGGNITQNGWQVQITGTPAKDDSFTVQLGATGDNRNALASASGQTTSVLGGTAPTLLVPKGTPPTISINGATSAIVTATGSQAAQVNAAQIAQTAVNTQALTNVQSASGVDINEEAANLLKWQQAYQASAQALVIGNSTFTTLLNAINGG